MNPMNVVASTHSTRELGRIQSGTDVYHRVNLALFVAGFVTFITLYDMQPLLPVFSREYGVAPALGSLPLSISTCTLAIAMLFTGTLSETWGRKQIMTGALFVISFLALLSAFSHTFVSLLLVRLLQGFALAGLPAVAMAYLGEEMDAASLGPAMGLYISGNAVGGMTGRIFTATMTDLVSWRAALGAIGIICLLSSWVFMKSLPPSHLQRRPFVARYLVTSLGYHLKEPKLRCLFGIAFIAVGSFVTLYNYITFRLLAAPYLLSQSHVSLIFLVYLLGSMSATGIGHLVNRFGRVPTIRFSLFAMAAGATLTLATPLPLIVAGVGLFTCGFFSAHAIASSSVSRMATTARAQATALYLFFYYVGSSVAGTVGGLFWNTWGWGGVVSLICLLLTAGFFVTIRLSSIIHASYPPPPAKSQPWKLGLTAEETEQYPGLSEETR